MAFSVAYGSGRLMRRNLKSRSHCRGACAFVPVAISAITLFSCNLRLAGYTASTSEQNLTSRRGSCGLAAGLHISSA
jgi:hypothetical protein